MAARGIFGLSQAAKTAAFSGRAGKKDVPSAMEHSVSEQLCGPCGHIPSKIKSKPSAACEVTSELEDAWAPGSKKTPEPALQNLNTTPELNSEDVFEQSVRVVH